MILAGVIFLSSLSVAYAEEFNLVCTAAYLDTLTFEINTSNETVLVQGTVPARNVSINESRIQFDLPIHKTAATGNYTINRITGTLIIIGSKGNSPINYTCGKAEEKF